MPITSVRFDALNLCLPDKSPALAPMAGESAEIARCRRSLEEQARKPGLAIPAAADLLRFDLQYLQCDWSIRLLQQLRWYNRSPTALQRKQARQAFEILCCAMRRGKQGRLSGSPYPFQIAILYDLLLPLYRRAKKGELLSTDNTLPSYVVRWLKHRKPGTVGGMQAVPSVDLALLKGSGNHPSDFACKRVATLLGIGQKDLLEDLTWVRRLVSRGRRAYPKYTSPNELGGLWHAWARSSLF